LLVVIVLIEITFSLLSSGKAQLECAEYAHTNNPAAVLLSHVGNEMPISFVRRRSIN